MTIPSTGSFKASDLNIELGRSSGAQLKASDTTLRQLAGDTSGQYEASDFRGKSYFTLTTPDTSKFFTSPEAGFYYFNVTSTVTGGATPISYQYSVSGVFQVSSQSGNTVTLRVYCPMGEGIFNGTLTVTATDSNNNQLVDTGSVTVDYIVGSPM